MPNASRKLSHLAPYERKVFLEIYTFTYNFLTQKDVGNKEKVNLLFVNRQQQFQHFHKYSNFNMIIELLHNILSSLPSTPQVVSEEENLLFMKKETYYFEGRK